MLKTLWLIISFNFIYVFAYSQTVRQTIIIADSLCKWGETDRAVKLYERVGFFATAKQDRRKAFSKLADIYATKGELDKAVKTIDLAYYNTIDDSIKKELLFRKTYYFIVKHDFLSAQETLLSIDTTGDKYLDNRYLLYSGTVAYLQSNFNMAYESFSALVNDTITLAKLMKKAKRKNKINPFLYFIMSLAIPGSGQLATGHIKQGLNSMLLLSALGGLFVAIAKSYTWIDAGAIVFPWYQRYLLGGANDASTYASKMKEKKLYSIYRQVTSLIVE